MLNKVQETEQHKEKWGGGYFHLGVKRDVLMEKINVQRPEIGINVGPMDNVWGGIPREGERIKARGCEKV